MVTPISTSASPMTRGIPHWSLAIAIAVGILLGRWTLLWPKETIVLPPGLFFVIYTPSHSEQCGGCTVLHVLVDRLNRRYGSVHVPVAYVVPMGATINVSPALATPFLPSWMKASDGIVVYPEIVNGNPLNGSKVVRWILYFPGG